MSLKKNLFEEQEERWGKGKQMQPREVSRHARGLQWHQRSLFLKPNGIRAQQKSSHMELDCQENHWIHTLFGVCA